MDCAELIAREEKLRCSCERVGLAFVDIVRLPKQCRGNGEGKNQERQISWLYPLAPALEISTLRRWQPKWRHRDLGGTGGQETRLITWHCT